MVTEGESSRLLISGNHEYPAVTVTRTGSPTSGLLCPVTGGKLMQTPAGLAMELVPPLRNSRVSA
jgi:hypothetical protein